MAWNKVGLGQRIKAAREHNGWSQAELGRILGVTRSSVSQWESELTEPSPAKLRGIALMARVDYEWLATARGSMLPEVSSEDIADRALPLPTPKTVRLKGYVGASGEAHFYRLSDEDLEEVPAPDGATDSTVAVEVRGKSLGPALESWLVYYDDVRSPVTPDMLNQLCVVGLADDRLLVKRLERKGGEIVLVSNNGEPDIRGAKIEWAAKVTNMRPR